MYSPVVGGCALEAKRRVYAATWAIAESRDTLTPVLCAVLLRRATAVISILARVRYYQVYAWPRTTEG